MAQARSEATHANPFGRRWQSLLRIAAKYADYVNIAAPVGKEGRPTVESLQRLADYSAFRERVDFVRAEAKRAGRDPYSIKISVLPNPMIADSPAATLQTIEMMSQLFQASTGTVQQSLALIGTPEQCAAILRCYAKELDVSQVIFYAPQAGIDEKLMRRLREEVIAHV